MKKAIHLIYLALYGFLLSSCAQSGSEQRFVNENVEFACRQTSCMLDLLGAPDGRYPRTVGDDGKLVTTDIYGWTSGFFPGSLWLLYELTGDEKWRREADAWTAPLEPNKLNVNDHDVGPRLGQIHRQRIAEPAQADDTVGEFFFLAFVEHNRGPPVQNTGEWGEAFLKIRNEK